MSSSRQKIADKDKEDQEALELSRKEDYRSTIIQDITKMDVLSDDFNDLLFMMDNKKRINDNKRLICLLGA